MSKHWNPRVVQGARPAGRRRVPMRPAGFRPHRRRGGFSWGELRAMLLGGVALGLVAALYGTSGGGGGTETDLRSLPVPDYWAESKKSRALLRDQEDGPIPQVEPRGSAPTRVGVGDAVDVIDGDTFRFGGATIRIADIDTPEVDGRCASESALAARATERMGALLAAGPFELHPIAGRDEDRYGRKLRIVTRGNESLGDRLVAEGLARTWTGRREPWC